MPFDASQLSQENILRDVHDNSTQSLRVSAFAIPPPGGIEVSITHVDDSIRLGDGTNLITATQLLSQIGLDVNVINPISAQFDGDTSLNIYPLEKGLTKNTYDEVLSVAQGIQTTIVTYTVPALTHGYLTRVDFSGTNIATYEIQVNTVVQDKKRTNFAVSLNDFTNFESNGNSGLPIFSGDVIIVTVLHDRPDVGDFNARILAIEVDD